MIACFFTSAGVASLSRLAGSLTRLEISWGEAPASLAALTRLQHLLLRQGELPNEAIRSFSSSLQHLTQLTCLVSACWVAEGVTLLMCVGSSSGGSSSGGGSGGGSGGSSSRSRSSSGTSGRHC